MRWVDALFSFIDIMLLYLPPYSPDLNPIEESFSTCVLIHGIIDCDLLGLQMILLGKSYIRRNAANLRTEEDPILMLLDSTGCITGEMAEGWFHHAGYMVD